VRERDVERGVSEQESEYVIVSKITRDRQTDRQRQTAREIERA